jgi:LysM repeat protein
VFFNWQKRQLAVNTFMRWRVLFWLSLVANLVLVAAWVLSVKNTKAQLNRAAILSEVTNAPAVKTAVIVRRQFFSWQEVESDDYPTYIKNLRDISCPEQTIRDIIIADVNALYARRRALEVVTTDQQWWRAEPDTNVLQVANAKVRELEQERRDLLTTLLGANWEGGDLVSLPRPSRAAIPLDGPVLGTLPMEVKQAVEQISVRAADRIDEYLAAQRRAGKTPDPAELARLRQQTRRELAGVLSSSQLEEYLLRYSDSARSLRTDLAQLKSFNATADEFRSMFRALDPINEQLAALDDSTPQGVMQRDTLLAQGEAAMKLALGEKRYAQYQLMHDARYRDAYAEALKAGNPESAGALYEIKLAAQQEQTRINGLDGLTDEQRAIELKKAELEQLKAAAAALGQELPPEPAKPPKPVPTKIHSVANGEGLDRIARIYGVQPSDLRAANPTVNFEKLKAGDKVSVPLNLIYPVLPLPE